MDPFSDGTARIRAARHLINVLMKFELWIVVVETSKEAIAAMMPRKGRRLQVPEVEVARMRSLFQT